MGGGEPEEVLEDVREAVNTDEPEANLVLGDFDIIACISADTSEELVDILFHRIRRVEGVQRTETLHVIDYVSRSEDAPEGHRDKSTG